MIDDTKRMGGASTKPLQELKDAKSKGACPCICLAKDDHGSALVEMAFALPTFFLLVFGFINFMLIMFGMCNLSYAGRNAARYACLHSNASSAPTALSDLTAILAPFDYQYPSNTITPKVTYSNGNVVGSTATVSVTVVYKIVLPLYTYSGLTFKTAASGLITQ